MKIIYVDDEEIQLENFQITAKDIDGMEDLKLFSDSRQAYEWAKEHPVDVAFLDIEMPHMDGIHLAEKLKEINRRTCIIFVTAYEQYALKAMTARPAGYLLKPYDRADIEQELENASFVTGNTLKKKICIQTMPDLLVTVNGENIFKGHSKSEELFALLVDRGKVGVSKQDAIACLWEGKQLADSTYGTCLYRLKNILEEAGISQLLVAKGNTKYLDIDSKQIDCDLYRMLNGDKEVITAYAGMYLRRYSWAEERTAQLNIIKRAGEISTKQ
ncbi:response regulator [Blautia sp. MSJ-9]|uniref:response regulator n=1 Tax=Blautia sp. MSJ-9 TaxID=2841511 RepID=UPI001C10269B|nr:response regulator [Blautia sp. MSJ-9]MBU5680705.1 response regulator [Blautia sp. MSJ-9]